MNILIVTSHTGGHFYPAVVVAKQIEDKVDKIVFILQKQKEKQLLEVVKKQLSFSKKINIEYINSEKFIRKNPFSLFKFFISFLISSSKILYILYKYKPKILFSTGGYTSVPVVILTKIFLPFTYIILNEQNCVLSLSNKFLSIFASKIFTGFEIKKDSKKFIFTGNPLRENFLKYLDKQKLYTKFGLKEENFTILIFGGSQGATSINYAFINILKNNKIRFKNCQIIHITGFKDFDKINQEYKEIEILSNVMQYYENIEELYTISDLVISRAGAMTITELIYFKKPAILIPLPYAAELHQHKNAELLKKNNCVKVVYQKKFWENKLKEVLLELLEKKEDIIKMSENYKYISQPKTTIEREIKNILYIKSHERRKC